MRSKKLRCFASVLLAVAMIFSSLPASLQARAEEKGSSGRWESADDPTLRDYAVPSVSFVGWGQGPDNFADENMDTFWNGHSDEDLASYNQWMMYDWSEFGEAEVSGSTIQFFDDGGGVMAPTGITIEYDENGAWKEVTKKGDWSFAANTVNTYEFEPVTTTKIRVTMAHAVSGSEKVAVAVNDWKLIGEVPDSFPKPEAVEPEAPSEDLKLPDAAVYAIPSSDYTSDWENLNGINDETFNPTSSDMGQTGLGWGNWPQSAGSEHWLQYEWDEELTTKTFQVYWYGSESGMKIPSKVRFEYQDASGSWKEATLVSNKKNFSKYNQYNQITIEPVTTKAIRMYMTVAGDSNGVYRWKVYSDISDEFVVSAAGQSLEIPEVKEGKVASRIRKSLTLPKTAMNGKVNVSWKSGNPDVISDDGKITPPAENTKVKLTATCTLAGDAAISKDKEIEILVLSDKVTEYAMTIDQKNKGVDISQELFGVFYEDINSAADGGLSTEMVKNNSFENYQNLDSATAPEVKGDQTSWRLHWKSSNSAGFVVERTDGLNENNKNYAKITGSQKLTNHGFVEKAKLDQSAMAITKDDTYDFSMFMKADSAYPGTVKVRVVDDSGNALTDEAALTLKKDGKWEKISASLKGTETKLGTLELNFEGAGASDAMYIDMVSLIPTDGYGYGNKNYSYGAGLRKDLVEKLQALNPSFIRFPGGCVIEGSYGTDGYYNWEDSVGPLEERRAIGSYWGTPGHPVNYTDNYGYMMSYQFGYHEILTLCEDLGAQAFPILSAGIYCQFRNTAEAATGDALEPFAKHATNLIDYCWGDPDSTDATQKYWASKRVENGHEATFDLNYIGIGNENWGETYYSNYKWIKDYVEKYVKEHYPDKKITLISSTGPYYQGSQNTEAWNWINSTMPGETLVDEHYYINYAGDAGNTLLTDDYAYDQYKRLANGGSNVFIGEYAGHLNSTTENVLDTAISEAAYMTGIERNADIVRHASYAPLFEREGCRDWDYNLIKFDAYESYGTPSYYVQTMYSNNYGKHILNTTLEKYNSDTSAYDEKKGHQTELYYVSSEDDDYIYTKLVNHDDYSKEITLNYPGVKDGTKVELICLSGDAMDMNTMAEKTKVAPVTTQTSITGGSMTYEVPAMSLTVVKVNYSGKGGSTDQPGGSTDQPGANAAVKVSSVKFGAKTYKVLAGKKLDLSKKVKVAPNNAANKSLKWAVSNTKYAAVSKKGVVSAKAAGAGKTVTVTAAATDGSGKKATAKVKITDAVKKITLKAAKSVKAGKSVKVKATVNTIKKKNAKVTLKWTVSNKKYATVSKKGVVKTKKAGAGKTVKVTAAATDGSGKKATCKIKIKK